MTSSARRKLILVFDRAGLRKGGSELREVWFTYPFNALYDTPSPPAFPHSHQSGRGACTGLNREIKYPNLPLVLYQLIFLASKVISIFPKTDSLCSFIHTTTGPRQYQGVQYCREQSPEIRREAV